MVFAGPRGAFSCLQGASPVHGRVSAIHAPGVSPGSAHLQHSVLHPLRATCHVAPRGGFLDIGGDLRKRCDRPCIQGALPPNPRRRFGEQGKGTKLVSPRGEPGGSQTARPTSRAPDGVATRWPPATLAADRAARLADAHAARRDQPDPEWRGVARERGA